MPSPTRARDQATRCAASDPPRSLALARQVDDPWFRCQALAWAARFAPDAAVPTIVREAFAAAAADPDPYKVVGASAWPARAAIERGQVADLAGTLRRLLGTAETIAHPVRRLDALFLLFQAVHPLGGAARRDALAAVVSACLSARSWRAGRTMRDAALMVASEDPAGAARLAELLSEGRHRRQALRGLAAGKPVLPRAFFR